MSKGRIRRDDYVLSGPFIANGCAAIYVGLNYKVIVISNYRVRVSTSPIFFSSRGGDSLAIYFRTRRAVSRVATYLFRRFYPSSVIFLVGAHFRLCGGEGLLTIFYNLDGYHSSK